jgi:hypothetical protein
MSRSRFTFILFAVVVAAPFAHATAQGGKGAARDPGDPKAAVPPVRYDSPFARYRPNAEVEVGVWRDTNDHVGRIGGWRVYGREAVAEPKGDNPPVDIGRNGSGAAPKPENGHQHRGPR